MEGRTGRSPQIWCPPIINSRRGSRCSLECQNRADKRERCRWRLESPNISSRSLPYKTKSERWEVKWKVDDGGDGGGDSDSSDLVDKNRRKRKIKWKNKKKRKRKRAPQPRSDHRWSRSPSHEGEGRSRSPEHGGERWVRFRGLGGFLWKVLG